MDSDSNHTLHACMSSPSNWSPEMKASHAASAFAVTKPCPDLGNKHIGTGGVGPAAILGSHKLSQCDLSSNWQHFPPPLFMRPAPEFRSTCIIFPAAILPSSAVFGTAGDCQSCKCLSWVQLLSKTAVKKAQHEKLLVHVYHPLWETQYFFFLFLDTILGCNACLRDQGAPWLP